METHINSWGNSLAVRIPKALAKELGFEENSLVDIGVEGGTLFVKPVISAKKSRRYTLEELCANITPENSHGEISGGFAVGKEIIEDDWS